MTESHTQRFELHVLGAPDLRAPDGRRLASVLSQPSRLSLLAYLALSPGPVTRSSVVADFWPESDETRARNALSQALFYLRRSMDKDAVRSVEGDRLWLPPDRVWCDARELLTEDRPSAPVVSAAAEGLLTGWNAEESQPLQEWLDATRRRIRDRVAELADRTGGPPVSVPPAPASDPGGLASDPGPLASAPRPSASALRRSAPAPGSLAAGAPPRRAEPRFPVGARSKPGRRGWLTALAAAGLVGLALAVARAWGPPPAALVEPPTERLAVLMPRVASSPGSDGLSALTLNAELLARLPPMRGVEVVAVPYASSLQELGRQLEVIGAEARDAPDWILVVHVVVTDAAAHVVPLLYRGGSLRVSGRVSFDEPYDDPNELAIRVPRAIGERVGAMVARVVVD